MKIRGAFSAAAALLLVATAAQAQRGRDDRRGGQDQHQQAAQAAPQQPGRPGGDWRGQAQQRDDRGRNDQFRAQQAGAEQARAEQARADQARADQARAAAVQNQRRAEQQNEQWRDQQNRQIQQDQINRQRQAQQAEQFQQQQQLARERQLDANRVYERDRTIHDYNVGGDVRLVPAYRYRIGGVYRETSVYGADLFRQAVDQGYDEGYNAGLNDRRDGASPDVGRALQFESGSFGYSGPYVPADDYSYYFDQGFQRGYDDAYWGRTTYGTFVNGKAAILGAVALGILGLTSLH